MSVNTHLKYCFLTLRICNLGVVRAAQAEAHHATRGADSAAQTSTDHREFICELPTWSKLHC